MEKRNKLGELLVNQVLIIENVLDIICFSDNKIYLKKPNKIIDLFLNENYESFYLVNVLDFKVDKDGNEYYKQGEMYVRVNRVLDNLIVSENLLLFLNGEVFLNNLNNKIEINGVINKGSLSSRHIVLYDESNDLIYTKSFVLDNNYNGLGRDRVTIMGEKNNNEYVGLGIGFNKTMDIYSSVNIGSSIKNLNNDVANSLCIESSIGVGCLPLSDFALRLKGDILLEEGNIYRNDNKTDIYSNISVPLSLDDYVRSKDFDDKIDVFESKINDLITSNVSDKIQELNVLTSNLIEENINFDYRINESSNVWKNNIEYNSAYVLDKQVSINKEYSMDGLLGNNKVPALYVGNGSLMNGKNVQGLICENDIAAFSDIKIKKNIRPISDSLNKVLSISGVIYKRSDILNYEKDYMGVIAQDVEKYCPEVVEEVVPVVVVFSVSGVKVVSNLGGIVVASSSALDGVGGQLSTVKITPASIESGWRFFLASLDIFLSTHFVTLFSNLMKSQFCSSKQVIHESLLARQDDFKATFVAEVSLELRRCSALKVSKSLIPPGGVSPERASDWKALSKKVTKTRVYLRFNISEKMANGKNSTIDPEFSTT